MRPKRCPLCGAYLDPGERCDDCKENEAAPWPRDRPQTTIPDTSVAPDISGVKHKEAAYHAI